MAKMLFTPWSSPALPQAKKAPKSCQLLALDQPGSGKRQKQEPNSAGSKSSTSPDSPGTRGGEWVRYAGHAHLERRPGHAVVAIGPFSPGQFQWIQKGARGW